MLNFALNGPKIAKFPVNSRGTGNWQTETGSQWTAHTASYLPETVAAFADDWTSPSRAVTGAGQNDWLTLADVRTI